MRVVFIAILMAVALCYSGFPARADALSHYNQGVTYSGQGRYDQAIAEYNQAMRLDQRFSLAYSGRGTAYCLEGEYDRATADHDQAIRLDPANAMNYNQRGNCYAKKHEYDRAIADYGKALILNPNYINVYLERGVVLYYKGEYDLAIADLDRVIRLDPKNAHAYADKCGAYNREGEYDLAIANCDQAIRFNPKLANSYSHRGWAFFQKGDKERALIDINEALRLDPKYVRAREKKGYMLLASQDAVAALQSFDEALRVNPTSINALCGRGYVLELLGQPELAQDAYKKAIDLEAFDPEDADIQTKARARVILSGAETAVHASQTTNEAGESPKGVGRFFDFDPTALGTISDAFIGKSNTAPIFIIGEEHMSRAGQLEIAAMLGRLYKYYGLRHIALEGMTKPTGALDATWFHRANGNSALKEDVAVRMLGEGEISSAELMALVHSDIKVFGAENESEYLIKEPLNRSDLGLLLKYLLAKGSKSLTAEQLRQARSLAAENKFNEVLILIASSDEWVAAFLQKTLDLIRAEASQRKQTGIEARLNFQLQLRQRALQVDAPIDAATRQELDDSIVFLQMAVRRSATMIDKTLAIAAANPGEPTALIVGVAHTPGIAAALKARGITYIVFIPIFLLPEQGTLSFDQFERKNNGRWARVSPGTLGGTLDGHRKEPPVIETPTAKSYASMQMASILIAGAAREGKNIPGDVWAELPNVSEITFNKGSFSLDGLDVIFSASLTTPEGHQREVWARVGTLFDHIKVEPTLEQKLVLDITTFIENKSPRPGAEDEGPGDQQIEGQAGQKLIVQRINSEVVAVYGATRDAVAAVGRISIEGIIAGSRGFDTSNLKEKLETYLLNINHPQNQGKAAWFNEALGFNQSNWQGLAKQLYFDEKAATTDKSDQYGTRYFQDINIIGANGREIVTRFVFLKDQSGQVRLITGIPSRK